MSLFWSSWSNSSKRLSDFLYYYGFLSTDNNLTSEKITIWRCCELLWTIPEIVDWSIDFLTTYRWWRDVLPEDHINWRYDYSQEFFEKLKNLPLDLTSDNLWEHILRFYEKWRYMPRYFIEILFYNINLKSIRDATQKFIQSLDSRKAFIPRKDENSDAKNEVR